MTRKDYELIAAVIGDFVDEEHAAILADVAESLASALKGDNPRFDRTRFLQACGVEE